MSHFKLGKNAGSAEVSVSKRRSQICAQLVQMDSAGSVDERFFELRDELSALF